MRSTQGTRASASSAIMPARSSPPYSHGVPSFGSHLCKAPLWRPGYSTSLSQKGLLHPPLLTLAFYSRSLLAWLSLMLSPWSSPNMAKQGLLLSCRRQACMQAHWWVIGASSARCTTPSLAQPRCGGTCCRCRAESAADGLLIISSLPDHHVHRCHASQFERVEPSFSLSAHACSGLMRFGSTTKDLAKRRAQALQKLTVPGTAGRYGHPIRSPSSALWHHQSPFSCNGSCTNCPTGPA